MLCACLGDSNMNKTQIAVGITQLLTSVYLVGWFFSIYWGYLIIERSKGDHNQIKQLINSAQGNSEKTNIAEGQGNGRRANNPYEDQ